MDSFTVRKRFRKEIEAEIIRRLQAGSNLRMSKSEIEEIGVAAGMRREYVTLDLETWQVMCGADWFILKMNPNPTTLMVS